MWDALSLPPLNHLAKGGLDQSSTRPHGSNQSSAAACRSHQRSKSASASS